MFFHSAEEIAMQKPILAIQALIVAMFLILSANIAGAMEQAQPKKEAQAEKPQSSTQDKKQIYGSQLMTREERAEHRAKMRRLKTREEREAFQIEHHKKMQERATKLGKTLPDMPPAQGCGPGCVGAGCGGAKCAEPGAGGAGY